MPDNHSVEELQAQLLRRIAAQDRSAVSEFYDQTAPALFSFALRVLGNSHDAEEVIQDVFVQIWNKAQSFDPAIGQPFHWAMSITRNRCIDRLRARQRRSRVLVEMDESSKFDLPAETSTEKTVLAEQELGEVRSAVGSLPKDQRQAIELAFFGGLTHQEIAEKLQEPLGTIKARIRRGMLKLRESLQAYT
jgi:RNA polymerase sigma-70 factor (ECF subfamily)